MNIRGRAIGPGQPCYLIAEMSANHNGRIERAIEIIRAAGDAGADAVKVQTYTADTLTIDCDNRYFQLGDHALWGGKTLYQLYREAAMPWDWHPRLLAEAERAGLTLFSTPYDETAVDYLEGLGVPAYKIASFELVDTPLLEKVAATGKPIILSTGMAAREEVETAVQTLRRGGAGDLALLRCVSAYPADPAEMHLRTIPAMAEEFGAVAGLSDHTMGSAVAVAAVALGASLIEKHLTLSRAEGGPDAAFSTEPAELRALVDAVRTAEKALGKVRYGTTRGEQESLRFRRSIFAVRDIAPGETFTKENVRVIRPGYGLPPSLYAQLLGRRAKKGLARGTPIPLEALED